jgi:RsiW-degrading membrane proteinase PrsW (M82 family)
VGARAGATTGGGAVLRPRVDPPRRFLVVLGVGILLYAVAANALAATGNPLYVPSLLVLGSAIVPATFATLLVETQPGVRVTVPALVAAAVVGGVIGTVVAGRLEFDTVHRLGTLPLLGIGIIEEGAKLLLPAAVLLLVPGLRAADGLVLGVTVGMGFAALETLGYAFVALLTDGGRIGPVQHLLLFRGVASPAGHAAWTGLACAALFTAHAARPRLRAWLRFGSVFALAVVLHALWDGTSSPVGYAALAAVSLTLLLGAVLAARRPVLAR